MRTKNELYQEALRTVAARRQMARARAEDARAEAEAAVPALRHAEDEVRVRGLRCALAGASGKDRTEAAAALADARQKLTALLAASGRPADALEPKFSCKLCQDTGTVNGRTCSCVHKVMQQLRRQEIEQLSSLSISSFDTMELRYYPNTMDAQNGVNIRAYMGRLLDGLKQYAEEVAAPKLINLHYCRNAILNALLVNKAADCEKAGIEANFDIKLAAGTAGFDDYDLVALVSNLLDNAIAAAGAAEPKQVGLTMQTADGALSILCRNSCGKGADGTAVNQGKMTRGNGRGIINRVVKKYGGEMETQPGDGCYTVSVMVFAKEEAPIMT